MIKRTTVPSPLNTDSLGTLSVLPREILVDHVIPEVFRQGGERSFYQASRSTYICTAEAAQHMLAVNLQYPVQTNSILGGNNAYKPRVAEVHVLDAAQNFLTLISAKHPRDLGDRAYAKKDFASAIPYYREAMALPDARPEDRASWARACFCGGTAEDVLLALPLESSWLGLKQFDGMASRALWRVGREDIFLTTCDEIMKTSDTDVGALVSASEVCLSFCKNYRHSAERKEKAKRMLFSLLDVGIKIPKKDKFFVAIRLIRAHEVMGEKQKARDLAVASIAEIDAWPEPKPLELPEYSQRLKDELYRVSR